MNKNYHYTSYNNLKRKFTEIIAHNLEGKVFKGKIGIEYVFYSKRKGVDRMNTCSLVCKFFEDSLQEMGCISNDTDEVVVYQLFRSGCKDAKNPRCEVTVFDLSVDED